MDKAKEYALKAIKKLAEKEGSVRTFEWVHVDDIVKELIAAFDAGEASGHANATRKEGGTACSGNQE